MSPDRGDDFELWLERELKQVVTASRGPSPKAEQAAYRAARRSRAPLTVRSARVTAAVIAVAVTVLGGVTGVAAVAGGASPATIGSRLVQAMCREHVTASQPGADVSGPDMGRCVIALPGQGEATPGRGVPSVDNVRSTAAPPARSRGQAAEPSPSPSAQDEDAQGDNGNGQGSAKRADPSPGKKPDKPPKDKHPQPTPS